MANASGGGGRAEAERWLEIAGRLLAARDLVGSKRFAERAMEADPMLEGVDSVLSVADVLLASQRRIGPHHVDWYAVLGVDLSADEATIRQQHHHLAMLLRPEVNSHAGAEAASHLVADALSFLTDPSKKKLIDNEIKKQSAKSNTSPSPSRAKTNSATPKNPAPSAPTPKTPAASASASASATATAAATSPNGSNPSAFWTACPFCCHLHQYESTYKDRSLLCPHSNCRRPFHASELPVTPPIVPGTDTYYSAWGFFPMGYPKPSELDENWKPFTPVFPFNPNQVQAETNGTPVTVAGSGGTTSAPMAATTRGKKTMARKKVGRPPKRQLQSDPTTAGAGSSGGNAQVIRGININEEAKGPDGGAQAAGGDVDMTNFQIDVDSTDELLGNLQNIPFLRDDVVPGRML